MKRKTRDRIVAALELAKKEGADLVIATDPDCDRGGLPVKTKDGYRKAELYDNNTSFGLNHPRVEYLISDFQSEYLNYRFHLYCRIHLCADSFQQITLQIKCRLKMHKLYRIAIPKQHQFR